MGRTAHCSARSGLYPPFHWAMRTAASSDVLRGAIGRARRTDPPSGGLFHVWSRILAGTSAAPYNLHRSVRTQTSLRPFARSAAPRPPCCFCLPSFGAAARGRAGEPTRRGSSRASVASPTCSPGPPTSRASRARCSTSSRSSSIVGFVGADVRLRRRAARRPAISHARAARTSTGGATCASTSRTSRPGIASAVFEATAIRRLRHGELRRRQPPPRRAAVGAKSAAFVPLLVEERVTAVISVATLDERRVFSNEDLAVMQTLAAEAAVALERLRAGVALEEALEAERGAARAADRAAPRRPRAQQRARPAGRPAAARRPARRAARRRRRRLLPPRPRARRSSAASRCTASTARCSASSFPIGHGPRRCRRPRGAAADRERVRRDRERRFRIRPTTASPT